MREDGDVVAASGWMGCKDHRGRLLSSGCCPEQPGQQERGHPKASVLAWICLGTRILFLSLCLSPRGVSPSGSREHAHCSFVISPDLQACCPGQEKLSSSVPSSSPASDSTSFSLGSRDAKCGKIQCQASQSRPLEYNAVAIDTTITINGREVQCRGIHVYQSTEEENDMLDPGLVLTGTKCGYNHVSLYLQLHSGFGLQRTVTEEHELRREDA